MTTLPLSDDDINQFINTPVYHPTFNRALMQVKRAFNSYGRELCSCYVTGLSGTGKSTLANTAFNKIMTTVKHDKAANIIPVVLIKLKPQELPQKVMKKILKALNVDASGYSSTNLDELFEKQLKICKVQLIMFDECQHLLRQRDKQVNENAANFIKNIIDEMEIPVALFGMPNTKELFKLHDELNTRCISAGEFRSMNIEESNQRNYFKKFVQQRMKDFPLKTVDLSDGKNLDRLFLAIGGVLRIFGRLLSEVLAKYRDNNKALSLEDYQSVYDYIREAPIINKQGKEIHPFTDDFSKLEMPLARLNLKIKAMD